jgi:hypothetical protein
MKKKFFGIPVMAILIVIALMCITGGAVFATFSGSNLGGTGTITVVYSYSYEFNATSVEFANTSIFSDQPLSVTSSPVIFTNIGNHPVSGFVVTSEDAPTGMVLSTVASKGGNPVSNTNVVLNGETATLTFTLTANPNSVTPGIYDLSDIDVFCNVTPIEATVVFDTGITSDTVGLVGTLATSFTIPTGNTASMHVIGLQTTTSVPELANGSYAFTLQADATQQSELVNYFDIIKGWNDTDWLNQINSQISGASPFFYLKVNNGVYSLVDNFKKTVLDYTDENAVLTIDDDYLVGTYVYTGVVTGTNGATQPVTVTLEVVRLP